jgi:hypothetical protein
MGRQGEQVRLLFLIEVDRPALGFLVDAQVRGVGQPVGCDLVQMLERSERPAIEQVLLGVPKWPLDLTFGEKRVLQTVVRLTF